MESPEEGSAKARSALASSNAVASSNAPNDRYQIRSLSRALRILKCFDVARPSWRLAELSKETGLDRSTCFRMVKTFETEGFLALEERTGEYHLGGALLPAVYLMSTANQLAKFAHPYVLELANLTKETIALAVWASEGVMVVDQVLTSHPFKLAPSVGLVFTTWGNAHVKLFVALGPESRQQQLYAWNPDIAGNALRLQAVSSEIQRIRAEQIAYDMEESDPGICAVAAPVRDRSGAVTASLGVVTPTERFHAEQNRHHTDAVRQVSLEMSRALGWVPG